MKLLSLVRLFLRLNKIYFVLPISVAKPLEVNDRESLSLSCSAA